MRINKDSFLKIWRDPVWSKVIATGIITFCGIIGSSFISFFQGGTFGEAFNSFLKFKIPVWCFLMFLMLVGFVQYLSRKRYPFLKKNETTEKINQFYWTWDWAYDKNSNKYLVENVQPLCPKCKGVLVYHGDLSYACGKCQFKIGEECFRINEAREQIVFGLKKEYPQFRDLIALTKNSKK